MQEAEKTAIPFETTRIPDGDKPVGEELVVQDGVDGYRVITKVDGQIVSDKTTHPKNKVVFYGTKEVESLDEEIVPENTETVDNPSRDLKDENYIPSPWALEQHGGILSKLKAIGDNMNSNALLVRAFKTFVQSFAATWAVTNFDFTKGAIIGAIAAGISALMNLFIQPVEAK